MKLVIFNSVLNRQIGIPLNQITGFVECPENCTYGNTFIATGTDRVDGDENGFYVVEKFKTVEMVLKTENE